MDIKNLIRKTLKGLEATAIEKITVLGVEGARDDLERIKNMVDELVCFWELDESLIDEYDVEVGLYKK